MAKKLKPEIDPNAMVIWKPGELLVLGRKNAPFIIMLAIIIIGGPPAVDKILSSRLTAQLAEKVIAKI